MKKMLLIAGLTGAAVSVAQAQKMDYDFYVAARGGYSILDKATIDGAGGASQDISYDNGIFAAVALGLRNAVGTSGSGFRLEVEGSWMRNDLKELGVIQSGNWQSYRLFGNLYYDQALTDAVYLYIGGGVGGVQYHMKAETTLSSSKDQDTVFGYQGMVGLGVRLTSYLLLEGGYRITSSNDPTFDFGTGPMKTSAPLSHIFEVGIRVEF